MLHICRPEAGNESISAFARNETLQKLRIDTEDYSWKAETNRGRADTVRKAFEYLASEETQ